MVVVVSVRGSRDSCGSRLKVSLLLLQDDKLLLELLLLFLQLFKRAAVYIRERLRREGCEIGG